MAQVTAASDDIPVVKGDQGEIVSVHSLPHSWKLYEGRIKIQVSCNVFFLVFCPSKQFCTVCSLQSSVLVFHCL